jgi:hypothetical protein
MLGSNVRLHLVTISRWRCWRGASSWKRIFGQDEQDGRRRIDGKNHWWQEAFGVDNREFARVLTPHPQSRTRSLPLARP